MEQYEGIQMSITKYITGWSNKGQNWNFMDCAATGAINIEFGPTFKKEYIYHNLLQKCL